VFSKISESTVSGDQRKLNSSPEDAGSMTSAMPNHPIAISMDSDSDADFLGVSFQTEAVRRQIASSGEEFAQTF
jgi:hypothetical protein